MKVTTVMVVILIVWCVVTVFKTGAQLPPLPSLANMTVDHKFLGWLTGTRLSHIMWIVALVGMGHSGLAMSGEETLAQVNRDVKLLHNVWLEITADTRYAGLHHYHVVAVAFQELKRGLRSEDREP